MFIATLFLTFILNLYIIIFGKKNLEILREKISIKKYLSEINDSLVSLMGNNYANILKIVLVILSFAFIIFNAFIFIQCLLAVILGTFIAKKSYQVPAFNNVLNKILTYINRLK